MKIKIALLLVLSSSLTLGFGQSPATRLPAGATLQRISLPGLQLDAAQQVMREFNQKVETELRKQPQYNQMMADLDRLKALTDPGQRRVAVAQYQTRYKSVLDASLAAAKLTKADLLAQLQRAAPDQSFSMTNDYGIRAISRSTAPNRFKLAQGSTAAPSQPSVQIVRLTDFEQEHNKTGGLASSGEADFTSNSVKAAAGAAIAGACDVDAIYSKAYKVPGDVRKATLKLRCLLESDAYTLSVAGPSAAVASASCSVFVPNGENLTRDIQESKVLGVVAWAMADENSLTVEEEIDLPLNKTVEIHLVSRTKATVVISGYSDAHARVKSISAEVHLQR